MIPQDLTPGKEIKEPNVCPVCGHSGWCFVLRDGNAINCKRMDAVVLSYDWKQIGTAKDGSGIYVESSSTHSYSNVKTYKFGNKVKPMKQVLETTTAMLATTTQLPKTKVIPGLDTTTTIYKYDYNKEVRRYDKNNPQTAGRPKSFCPYHEIDGRWIGKLGDTEWPLYNALNAETEGENKWVLFVEGEKCVDKAMEEGLLAVTAQGSQWNVDYLAKQLQKLKNKFVEGICILPDNDLPGEKKAQAVKEACESIDLPCVVIPRNKAYPNMPEKYDIVDLVSLLGNTQNNQLEVTMSIQNYLEKLLNEQLKELYLSVPNLDTGKTSSTVVKASSEKLKQRDLADILKDEYFQKVVFDHQSQAWYVYTGTNWMLTQDSLIEVKIHKDCNRIQPVAVASWYDQIKRFLKCELTTEEMFKDTGYISFTNGILNLQTNELIPHDPNFFITCVLPRDYSAMSVETDLMVSLAKHCPNFWKWGIQSMGNDHQKILLLLACINSVLTRRFAQEQRFLWLYGLPQSGKGTFTRLLTDLVGKENTYSTDLGRLDKDSEKAALSTSCITFLPDQDKTISGLATLKALTGQDTVSARRLYQESFSFTYTGTIVATSNTPIFYGGTSGLDRRMTVVHFKNSVAMEDRDSMLSSKLNSELNYLTPIALAMPEQLVRDLITGVGQGKVAEFEEIKWQTRIETDSIAAYGSERIVFSLEDSEPIGTAKSSKQFLYANYLDFCDENKLTPKNLQNFSRDLMEIAISLGHKVEKKRYNSGYKMMGLRLRDERDNLESLPVGSSRSTQHIQDKASESTPESTPESTLPISESTPIKDELMEWAINGDGEDPVNTCEDLGVDLSVDLKPLPDKESVDRVDLNPKLNFSKIGTVPIGSVLRYLPSYSNDEQLGQVLDVKRGGDGKVRYYVLRDHSTVYPHQVLGLA